MADKPLQPRRHEADWLMVRVKEEIARSQSIAPGSLIDEYNVSLKAFEEIAQRAR